MPSASTSPTNNTHESSGSASALIDLSHLLWVLRERWIGAMALVLLLCGAAGFALLNRPPVYEANADLMVERSSDKVMDVKQVVDNSVEGLTDAFVLTHIEQVQSHSFLSAFCSNLTPAQCAAALAAYPATQSKTARPPSDQERLETFLSKGAKNFTASRTGRTLLINLSLRHRNPEQARFLIDRIAESYITYLISRSSERNSAATSFLTTQSDELRTKVETSEKALQEYRETNNLVSLEDNQNIVAARVRDISTELTKARVISLNLGSRIEQAEKLLTSGGDPTQLARLTEFASLAEVKKNLDDLRTKRAVLAERYGPKHPAMLDNASAQEALGKILTQQVEAAMSDLRSQFDKAKAQEARLAEELSAAEKDSLRMSQLAVRFNVLKREVETARALYTQVLARQNETAITSQLQNTNIKFVDRAKLPTSPVEPNKMKVALILLLLAGAVGVGYPLIADMLDQRIKRWSDVETYLQLPLLAEVGTLKKLDEAKRDQVVMNDLDERGAEAFRALYSQIQLSSKVDFPKTILVTSTLPAEGKSFVASNMAEAFAAHDKRVLLIDGDLRRPSLHKGFELPNTAGLLTWLESKQPITEDLLKDPKLGLVQLSPKLSLLRTGGLSRKTSELLQTAAVSDLLEALQRKFDLVVIDTPPAGLFPDAEAFSAYADELVYVCRFSTTPRPQAAQVVNRLRKTKLSVVGAVLNAMPDEKSKGYYYSSYSYRDYAAYYTEKEKS